MVYLLHIDTSGDVCTIGLSADGAMLYVLENTEARNHAAFVNTAIQDVLSHCDVAIGALAGIAVCAGPGSYTGLRIGLATAKGMCYAADKPLYLQDRLALMGFSAMDAYGGQYPQYLALLPARTGEYFVAVYDADKECLLEPAHVIDTGLAEVLSRFPGAVVVTDRAAGPETIESLKGRELVLVGGKWGNSWSEYAFRQYNCNLNVKVWDAAPLYLKQVYTHNAL